MILGIVDWDPKGSYKAGALVIFNGNIYIAFIDNTRVIPGDDNIDELSKIYYPNDDPELHKSPSIWILL